MSLKGEVKTRRDWKLTLSTRERWIRRILPFRPIGNFKYERNFVFDQLEMGRIRRIGGIGGPCWLDRHSPTTDAPTRSKVDLIKTKNPVGNSPTRSLFQRGFCNDFKGLNPACGVSSKCSPPELRS